MMWWSGYNNASYWVVEEESKRRALGRLLVGARQRLEASFFQPGPHFRQAPAALHNAQLTANWELSGQAALVHCTAGKKHAQPQSEQHSARCMMRVGQHTAGAAMISCAQAP